MGSNPVERIGSTIRNARTAAGMSLSEMSRVTGISKPALSVLENGHGNPTVKTIEKVCDVLGLQVEIKPRE